MGARVLIIGIWYKNSHKLDSCPSHAETVQGLSSRLAPASAHRNLYSCGTRLARHSLQHLVEPLARGMTALNPSAAGSAPNSTAPQAGQSNCGAGGLGTGSRCQAKAPGGEAFFGLNNASMTLPHTTTFFHCVTLPAQDPPPFLEAHSYKLKIFFGGRVPTATQRRAPTQHEARSLKSCTDVTRQFA